MRFHMHGWGLMSNASRRPISSFTIIKGSLIEETYTVFQDWDFGQSKIENFSRIREKNPIGAKSSSWLKNVTWSLSRRFEPNDRDRPLVLLAKNGCDREVWKPLLLWHMTQDEFLLRDFLTGWLYEQFLSGAYRIRTEDVVSYIKNLLRRKDVGLKKTWSEKTIARVSSGLLRIAVDFGLMTGKLAREFIPFHLPDMSFIYLLHAMTESELNPRRVVDSPNWHMYLMDSADVERELFRLHQYHKLHYEVAGSLIQLKLPFESSAEYAKEVVA